jgi:hypothetical protein
MKWFLIDQLRLFIGIVVLAAVAFFMLLGWCWLANLPWLSAALHTELLKFVFLIASFGAAGAALHILRWVFAIIGIPLNLEYSERKISKWREWAFFVPALLVMGIFLEIGFSGAFLRKFGAAVEPSARAAIPALLPLLRGLAPIVGPHSGALAGFAAVSYAGLLLLPGFEVMIVLRRLLGASRDLAVKS